MTDKKFTDEEILEAMEHCVKNLCHCAKCPRFDIGYDTCHEDLYLDILALINRQKARIDDLKVKLDAMRGAANSYKMHYEEEQAELVDLRTIVFTDRSEAIKNLKSEAVKEFAKRLKDELSFGRYIQVDQIDNLVKEMTEERAE